MNVNSSNIWCFESLYEFTDSYSWTGDKKHKGYLFCKKHNSNSNTDKMKNIRISLYNYRNCQKIEIDVNGIYNKDAYKIIKVGLTLILDRCSDFIYGKYNINRIVIFKLMNDDFNGVNLNHIEGNGRNIACIRDINQVLNVLYRVDDSVREVILSFNNEIKKNDILSLRSFAKLPAFGCFSEECPFSMLPLDVLSKIVASSNTGDSFLDEAETVAVATAAFRSYCSLGLKFE